MRTGAGRLFCSLCRTDGTAHGREKGGAVGPSRELLSWQLERDHENLNKGNKNGEEATSRSAVM